eukprot:IDg18353t1
MALVAFVRDALAARDGVPHHWRGVRACASFALACCAFSFSLLGECAWCARSCAAKCDRN